MTSLLSLVLLILLSYLGSLIYNKLPLEKKFFRSVAYTGNLYLFLGFLIGPEILNLLTDQIINQLNVIYALVLGWAGFLIGLQTDLKNLKRFRKLYYVFSTSNFIIALILSSVLLIYISTFFSDTFNNLEIIILALAGAVTSPIMLGVVIRDFKSRGKVSHILQFVSGYDNILGVILLGVMMAAINLQWSIHPILAGIIMLAISVGIGMVAAYIYYLLSKELKKEQEIFLLIIGLLIFAVGMAYYLKLSLLFVAFVYGAGLSNFKINVKRLYLNIQKVEKPLYVLLLIFFGANITYDNSNSLIFLLIFLGVHFVILIFSGAVSNFIVRDSLNLSNKIGIANLGMGGLSLAIIMDFHLIHPSAFSKLLIFIVAISVIIYDFISYRFLKYYLVQQSRLSGVE